MQILPNGQVQITNNQTGETRVVDPSQLSSFSPLLANQYYNAMAESRANAKASSTGTTDVLTPPSGGNMQTMPVNQNTPNLSGLSKFAKPVVQPAPKPKVSFTPHFDLTGINQPTTQPAAPMQANTPWVGSQIANAWNNFWKTPSFKSSDQLGL